MNWKNEAIEKLEQYEAKKQAIETIPEEIARLASAAHKIRSGTPSEVSVIGSGSKREDALLNNIVKREELNWSLEQARKWICIVETGLNVLNEEERTILERFYIHAEKGAAEKIAYDFAMDVKTVYRRKDSALRRFTLALYGCMES